MEAGAGCAMAEKLSERVLRVIQEERMIREGERVGVGVSGGADSVALLRVLQDLQPRLGIGLVVLHFNHELRGPESDADERFVDELARKRGLQFVSGRGNVRVEAVRQGWNLEEASRRLRYAFFERQIEKGLVDRVAVAHTLDDQAETVLMRLARGAGTRGLAGIFPIREGIIRPLLGERREDLRRELAAAGETWREDASNQDLTRLRARVRHRVLPLLEKELSSGLVQQLGVIASLAQTDELFWDALLDVALANVARDEDGSYSLPAAELLRPSVLLAVLQHSQRGARGWDALASRMVIRLFERLTPESGHLNAGHVLGVLRFARAGRSGRRLVLPGGVEVSKSFERLRFSRIEAADARIGSAAVETSAAGGSYHLDVQFPEAGTLQFELPSLRKRLGLKVFDWPDAPRDTIPAGEALDRDLLRSPLVIRNWRPGDKYRPAGRRSVVKLKRLLAEKRVEASRRGFWPVLTSAGRVAWALGLPAAAEFAATPKTRTGLLIVEEPT
jgi:tRNA(Ile)-lysidine synthase